MAHAWTPKEVRTTCIIQLALYILLTFLNLYFFVTRVIRLKHAGFFKMMSLILQLVFTVNIALQSLKLYTFSTIGQLSDADKNLQSLLIVELSVIFFELDCVLHSVFVIKYWILSKKMQLVAKSDQESATEDSDIECRAGVIFAV